MVSCPSIHHAKLFGLQKIYMLFFLPWSLQTDAQGVTSAPVPVETPTEPEPAVVSNDTVEEDIDELLKDL